MSNPPPTLRVFVAGMSGSGKSRGAWTHYLARFPRRLLVDLTGEWESPTPWGYPGADLVVTDAAELHQALKKLAPRGRWTITASIGLEQLPEFVAYLIPVPEVSRSPIVTLGGAVLLVDEVDLVAPPRSLKEEVRTLWRRSRHVGLSLVATTQRPEAVSREVSAQSQHVLCLHLVEPTGIRYMQDLMGTDLSQLERWCQQHPHGGLWKEMKTGTVKYLTEQGTWSAPAPVSAPRPRGAARVPAGTTDAPGGDDGAASAPPPLRVEGPNPEREPVEIRASHVRQALPPPARQIE